MPNWRNPDFEWDEGNIDHIIDRHDVYPEEAEQVFRNGAYIRRSGPIYRVHGQDDSGRYLLVVCERRGKQVRVISARPMEAAERRHYDRRR